MWMTPDGNFDGEFYLAKEDRLFMQSEIVNYRKVDQCSGLLSSACYQMVGVAAIVVAGGYRECK